MATNQFVADPNVGEPFPPAIAAMPVGRCDRPMVSTTVPVTNGGKYFLSGLIKNPKNPQKIPPTKVAPKSPDMPKPLAIAILVGRNPKLVPITTGNLAPTLQSG